MKIAIADVAAVRPELNALVEELKRHANDPLIVANMPDASEAYWNAALIVHSAIPRIEARIHLNHAGCDAEPLNNR